VVYLARRAIQDLCNRDTSDMKSAQLRSLSSLSLYVFLVLI